MEGTMMSETDIQPIPPDVSLPNPQGQPDDVVPAQHEVEH